MRLPSRPSVWICAMLAGGVLVGTGQLILQAPRLCAYYLARYCSLLDAMGPGCGYVRLEGADLSHMNLRGFDLSAANLRYADLRGADLRGASLFTAVMDGAVYDEETRWPVGFDPEQHGARQVDIPRLSDQRTAHGQRQMEAGRGS
jgi:hypothetical protein